MFYVENTNMTISNSDFIGGSPGQGGVLFGNNCTIYIKNINFKYSLSSLGIINVQNHTTLHIFNSRLDTMRSVNSFAFVVAADNCLVAIKKCEFTKGNFNTILPCCIRNSHDDQTYGS